MWHISSVDFVGSMALPSEPPRGDALEDDQWSKEKHVRRLEGEIAQFDMMMAERGTPFAIVVFPELNDVRDPERFSAPRKSLIGILEGMEIDFCDLTPVFATQEDPRLLYLPNDSVHFTVKGHRLARDAMLACASVGRLPLFP